MTEPEDISATVRLARIIFRAAAIYGLIVLLPLFFAEDLIARYAPPPLTHPEFYYGFLTSTLALQLVYWLIGSDPIRFRPLMPIAVLAKLGFVVAVGILFAMDRLDAAALGLPAIDLILAMSFAWVWLRLRQAG